MITAEQFSQAFEQATQEQRPNLLRCWWPPPVFTDYAKNVLMPSVAGNLGYYRELEYKRIDVVFKLSASSENTSQSKIAVAVELENVFGKSHEEVTKLRDFDAPLGVLITYAGVGSHQRLLSKFAEIMSGSKSQSPETDGSELLIIFGPYGEKPPVNLAWHHFVYKEHKFHALKI